MDLDHMPLLSAERGFSRRAMLVGTSVGAGALILTACVDEPDDQPADSEEQTAEPDDANAGPLVAELHEFSDAHGDQAVWQVGFVSGGDDGPPEIYSVDAQAARHDAVQSGKSDSEWTAQEPLLVLDPYGTTRTGLYVYFDDAAPGTLEYHVSVSNVPDMEAEAANHAENGTGYEGLVIGLVPGAHNDLTLTWTPEGGETVTRSLQIKAPATSSGYGTQLSAVIEDEAALSPGLFALSGIAGLANNTYLFDGNGVMRAEFPSTDSRNHNFVADQGRLVTTTGETQVTVIDPLGHATTIIDLGDHLLHHDIHVEGDIVHVLTSEADSGRVEDRVVRVDLQSGDVQQTVDLKSLLPEYEALAHAREGADTKDWIHVNSLQVVDGVMYLSGREPSTIVALDDALEVDSEPSVRWLIGVQELYAGTSHDEYFLAPEGSPTGNAGQHTVYRIDDDSLPDGQHYLEMFNNNYWYLGTRDPDVWEDIGPENASRSDTQGTSHVLRYLVDENTGTYREDFRIDVPYSNLVSSVFRLGAGTVEDAMVVNSGMSNEFSERRADGTVIASYRYDSSGYGYRVYKDPFAGFWFAAT